MGLNLRKTKYGLLISLPITIIGLVVFYFVDDVFSKSFALSLGCLVGGGILSGFLLTLSLIGASNRVLKVTGYLGSGLVLLVAIAITVAFIDYRLFFFYHRVTKEEWRGDLSFLSQKLEELHPNAFTKTSREDFKREIDEVNTQIPNLDDKQIAMRMIRLVALVGDGHTTSFPFQPAIESKMYPLQLYHFNDGLYVTDASDDYRNLIGLRVVRIEDTPIDQVYTTLRPFVAHDNEQAVLERIPLYYLCAGLLQSQAITKSADYANWSFIDEAGRQSTVNLVPVSLLKYFYWYARPLRRWKYKQPMDPATPLYLREDASNNYWFTYLESSKAVYVQINQFQNKRDESLTDFGKRIAAFVDAHPVDRLVIDLRRNTGGDNTIYGGFIDNLSRSATINQPGHLFTLIGRTTFSAAVNFTTRLEQRTKTLFVGEPTSAGPNHYGDAQMIKLPNSKIILFVSTRRWQLSAAEDTRQAYEPQIPVTVTHKDYFANRDVVLEAALRALPNN